jgi:acetylornithine deacetylase/succinyl-diaminopimelate desuccinylase-like protein
LPRRRLRAAVTHRRRADPSNFSPSQVHVGVIERTLPGERGEKVAHTIDEFVPVDDLVLCAQALALPLRRHSAMSRSSSGPTY